MKTIKVGLKTAGIPEIELHDGKTRLRNLLIGDGFHWEKSVDALLPGKVYSYDHKPCDEVSEADRTITLVNELPLEDYLECVVGSEMNPSAPVEFLKAHAVISRSWALGKTVGIHHSGACGMIDFPHRLVGWDDTAGHHGFHVCSDDHCQRYQGLQPITPESLKAIRDTAGEVLMTPRGEVVDARFSKCCGGKTEIFSTCWQDAEVECIEHFEDPWCDLSGLEETDRTHLLSSILKGYDLESTEGYGFQWTAEISKEQIGENLRRHFGRTVGRVLSLKPLHRGPSGRIDLLRINGDKGSLDIGKELWIRRILSPSHLYSSAFDIEDLGASIRLSGHGWGHGVGLCQIGAANMAAHGHDYRSILAFYYPGSILEKLY